jgi:hypothetical protein
MNRILNFRIRGIRHHLLGMGHTSFIVIPQSRNSRNDCMHPHKGLVARRLIIAEQQGNFATGCCVGIVARAL